MSKVNVIVDWRVERLYDGRRWELVRTEPIYGWVTKKQAAEIAARPHRRISMEEFNMRRQKVAAIDAQQAAEQRESTAKREAAEKASRPAELDEDWALLKPLSPRRDQ